MSKIIEQKQQLVADIADKFRASQSTILVDYRGLDVAELTDLRKQLRDAGVDYKVYKNTMTKRAVEQAELSGLTDVLVGPTAIAFCNDDMIAPAKVLNGFAKDHENLEIKAGVIEGEITPIEQIKELADLPNHDGMISMLLSVLQAPVRNFAYAAKAIADQKEEQGA